MIIQELEGIHPLEPTCGDIIRLCPGATHLSDFSLSRATLTLMPACHFCGRTPAASFALTVRSGDAKKTSSWCRHVLLVCPRCHRTLAGAGREGRVLKGTGERWFLGHTVGIFESRAADALHGRDR